MKQINKLDFSGQNIYVGIDTGKKSWKVTILTKDYEHKSLMRSAGSLPTCLRILTIISFSDNGHSTPPRKQTVDSS